MNLGQTRARGARARARGARPCRSSRSSGQYTYLDGEILVSPSDFDPGLRRGPAAAAPAAAPGLARRAALGRARWSAGATLRARWASGPTATSSASASREPRLHPRRRARCGCALVARPRGVRGRPRTCSTTSTRRSLGYPALGRVGARRAALRLGGGAAVSRERALLAWSSGKDSAFALHVLRAAEGRGGRRPADHGQRGLRPRGHARGAPRAARGAGRGGRPAARGSCAIPWPCPNEVYEAAMARRHGRRARARASPRWPSATSSSRTSAATARSAWRAPACGRSSRSGAGRRARWPRR